MSSTTRFLLSSAVIACAFAMPAPSHAALRQNWGYGNPADACQLSIPTTDTQVRPKASGYRNESTSKSAFVICGYSTPTYDSTSKQILIYFTSMDAVSRNISCTAVSGMAGAEPLTYSTKSISSPSWRGAAAAACCSTSTTCSSAPATSASMRPRGSMHSRHGWSMRSTSPDTRAIRCTATRC